jgi:hydroxyacylglutathione hydrolase
MFIQQLYTSCLSEAAYYIESNGEAAIIDPLRDTDSYLALAKERGATIKYIFETHFHADFVSGHIDLSQKTGAPIIYGPEAKTSFTIINATHNEILKLGDISIKALHTPGHTMESTCYLLLNNKQEPHAIFTGDTLFVGDVGRPDLFGGLHTKEDLATLMYHSLQNNILPLPDDVIVYPAHGAGSSCGKNLGKETFSTIGEQRANNYALQPQTLEVFVQEVTHGLNTPPPYFALNAKINKTGYDSLDNVMEQGMTALSIAAFKKIASEEDVIILDTRPATIFTTGFVPGSIFVGLEGRFAEWVGTVLPITKPIILVTEIGKEQESITRLARVGYDNVRGYLNGSYDAWKAAGEKIDMIIDIEADELVMDLNYDEKMRVIDVRKPAEYESGHIKDAELMPLNTLAEPLNIAFIDDEENLYIHCAGGYRSVIAASMLKAQGFNSIRNVLGGWGAISKVENAPIEISKAPAA